MSGDEEGSETFSDPPLPPLASFVLVLSPQAFPPLELAETKQLNFPVHNELFCSKCST